MHRDSRLNVLGYRVKGRGDNYVTSHLTSGVGLLVTQGQKSATKTLAPNNMYPNSVCPSDKSWFTTITIVASRGGISVSIHGGGISVSPAYHLIICVGIIIGCLLEGRCASKLMLVEEVHAIPNYRT